MGIDQGTLGLRILCVTTEEQSMFINRWIVKIN